MCQQALPTCMLLIALRFLHLQSPKLTKADVLLAVPLSPSFVVMIIRSDSFFDKSLWLELSTKFFFHLTAMAHPPQLLCFTLRALNSKHSCDSWHCTKARTIGIRERIVQCICSWSDMANPRTICWRCLFDFDFKLVVRMSLGLVSNMEALLYIMILKVNAHFLFLHESSCKCLESSWLPIWHISFVDDMLMTIMGFVWFLFGFCSVFSVKAAHGAGEAFYEKRSIDPPLSKLGEQQARQDAERFGCFRSRDFGDLRKWA